MKILMLNKYYYLKGGSERYYFELTRLLEAHGHVVIPFAMQDERNFPTPYARYFVPNVDYEGPLSASRKVLTALRTIYSPIARRQMERLIEAEKPDIVHAHNIYHQLSYSPLWAAKKHGIPVALTAHDYKLVCPNNALLCDSGTCEGCAGRYYRAVIRRCAKGRLAGSVVLAAEMYFNRSLFDVARAIDLVIAPSRFARDKLVQLGWPPGKVIHRFNTLDAKRYEPRFDGDGYALFLGRLAAEKGVGTLLRAMRLNPGVTLRVLGDGPEKETLVRFAGSERMRNVEFLGHQSGAKLLATIRNAAFVVVPSEWYENLPYSVLEAFALGKPVVASRIGGIPELIDEGKDGFLFTPKSAEELAERIRAMAALSPERLAEFGRHARAKVERDFDPEEHYEFMMETYSRVLEGRKKKG
jgi:glycosyltransferase involved in cell wall biosynthesis